MKKHIKGIVLVLISILGLAFSDAMAGINVVGDMTQEKSLKPGELFEGSLSINNSGTEAEDVKIYQTDYLFFADGRNEYGDPGKIPRSNASWITFSPRQATVPPKGSVRVNFSVKVPNDQNLIGTYWSTLMIEKINKGSLESSTPPADKKKIQMSFSSVMRYAVQIISNMGDTGTRSLKFSDPRIIKDGKGYFLEIDIENNGERILRPDTWIQLVDSNGKFVSSTDKDGKKTDRFTAGKQRTYPGTSIRFRFNLGSIAEGKYKSLVVADCGGDDVFGGEYKITVPK